MMNGDNKDGLAKKIIVGVLAAIIIAYVAYAYYVFFLEDKVANIDISFPTKAQTQETTEETTKADFQTDKLKPEYSDDFAYLDDLEYAYEESMGLLVMYYYEPEEISKGKTDCTSAYHINYTYDEFTDYMKTALPGLNLYDFMSGANYNCYTLGKSGRAYTDFNTGYRGEDESTGISVSLDVDTCSGKLHSVDFTISPADAEAYEIIADWLNQVNPGVFSAELINECIETSRFRDEQYYKCDGDFLIMYLGGYNSLIKVYPIEDSVEKSQYYEIH